MSRICRIVFLLLFLIFSSSCSRIASFYKRPQLASFYTDRYCFELPRKKLWNALLQILKQQKLKILHIDESQQKLQTQPAFIAHYAFNSQYAYQIGLQIQIQEFSGHLNTKHIAKWSLEGKTPAPPPMPQRAQFPDPERYEKALEEWQVRFQRITHQFDEGVALMKKWQGCRILSSQLRSIVSIRAKIQAFPLGAFNRIQKAKGRWIQSDKTFEYSLLRWLAYKVGKLKHIRRPIYR